MSKRDEYIAKLKKQRDQLNAKLEEVEAEAQGLTAEARKKYDQQRTELGRLVKSIKKQLEEMKTATEDQWDRLVAEGEKYEKAFIHSYNYFKSQLKQQH